MRRLELHPIGAGFHAIGLQPRDRVLQRAVYSVTGAALRHHHKVRVELVLHVDRRPVARNRLVERHDLDAGALGLALAFDRLVVDADPGNPGSDAFADHAPHRHDAAVPGVAVHDHRDRHGVGNPAGNRHAFGHRRGADIGKTGIGAHDPAGADKQRLAPGLLHDPGMRRGRRVQHRQNLVPAMDQFLQARRFRSCGCHHDNRPLDFDLPARRIPQTATLCRTRRTRESELRPNAQ
jgi:hypothetical protein